jgi:hypothetical protein
MVNNNENEKVAFLYTAALNSGDYQQAYVILKDALANPPLIALLDGINTRIYQEGRGNLLPSSVESNLDPSRTVQSLLPSADDTDPANKFSQEQQFERVMAGLMNRVTGRTDFQSAKDAGQQNPADRPFNKK